MPTQSTVRTAAVIGGGVAGLWVASALARRGIETTVLEARTVGSGASAGNAGWICPAQAGPVPGPGVIGYGLRSLGNKSSALYIERGAMPQLAPWLTRFARHCNARDFERGVRALCALTYPSFAHVAELERRRPELRVGREGMLVVAGSEATIDHYLHEYAPLAELGHDFPVGPAPLAELRAREPALTDRVAAGVHVADHWFVDGLELCAELAADLRDAGATIHEGVETIELVRRDGRIDHVRTTRSDISADVVVVATGASAALLGDVGVRIPLVGGKGYSFDVVPEQMPRHAILFMDAHVGCTPLGDRLRVAGTMELSRTGLRIDRERLATLENAVRPFIGDWEPAGAPWAGLRPLAPDGLPVIGRAQGLDNLFVATGYSMLGITVSATAGDLLAEEIVTGTAPGALDPFRPERFDGWRDLSLRRGAS